MMRTIRLRMLAVLSGVAMAANADVTLNGLFTDHMVLQRDMPVSVYGKAEPGEKVTMAFAGQEKGSTADKDGNWRVKLDALQAAMNSATLTVSGKNKVAINDVVVGDVWVCSGQSNMELLLGNSSRPDDVKDADFPLIRQFNVPHVFAEHLQTDVQGNWTVCTPQSAGNITAVGFYFARKVHQETGIPVGLIRSVSSGRPIEPFCSPDGLASIPELTKEKGNLDKKCGWHCIYNGMIHPLVKFRIKGALWYQGETNGGEGDLYYHKMRALIGGWRKAWNQRDFPFYFVQLPNYSTPTSSPEGGDAWAGIRMAQLKALAIANTGMAVTIDLADVGNPGNVHPGNKRDVGERLALWALARTYPSTTPLRQGSGLVRAGGKAADVVYSGPLFKEMKVVGNRIRVIFDNVGSGLMAATKKGYDPVVKDQQGKLQRFAIAGENRKWVWADAVIDGQTVVVSSPEVPKPVAVRYAYSVNPEGCNLYNNEGLPASPFRTDGW
jgi:sialate O-acetylesterase